MSGMMSYGAKVRAALEDAGFTFTKRLEDGYHQILMSGSVLGTNRSLGDLLRSMAKELGVGDEL